MLTPEGVEEVGEETKLKVIVEVRILAVQVRPEWPQQNRILFLLLPLPLKHLKANKKARNLATPPSAKSEVRKTIQEPTTSKEPEEEDFTEVFAITVISSLLHPTIPASTHPLPHPTRTDTSTLADTPNPQTTHPPRENGKIDIKIINTVKKVNLPTGDFSSHLKYFLINKEDHHVSKMKYGLNIEPLGLE